jgi:hypothetical protein
VILSFLSAGGLAAGTVALMFFVKLMTNRLLDYVTANKHTLVSKGIHPRAGRHGTYILFEIDKH